MNYKQTASEIAEHEAIKRDKDESACRQAYDNRYHKIRAAVGYDEFRAIWFKALESHSAYEAELIRLAAIGRPLADLGITLPPLDDESEHMILSVRKGTMNEGAQRALQQVVALVSNQTPFVVAAGDQGARLIQLAKLIDEKFQSGNDMPVTRITIDRSELEALIEDAFPSTADLDAAIKAVSAMRKEGV